MDKNVADTVSVAEAVFVDRADIVFVIVYDSQITVINVSKKLVTIIVTRTDNGVDPIDVQTVRIQNCILDTDQQKLDVEQQIKDSFDALDSGDSSEDGVVGEFENTLNDNLTTWELTR